MHRNDIIVFTVVMAYLAFRLYQKYFKKKDMKTGTTPASTKGTTLSSSSEDDDYEPYSKK
jgi:hypothetical protein